jgi:hypothetical protein
MDPCAARSARTLFDNLELGNQGSHPDLALRVEFFDATHARASNMR